MRTHRQIPLFVFLWAVLCAVSFAGRWPDDPAAVPARAEGSGDRAASQPRPWPVDVPVHLSSSFGEFRDGHLHAGVDIRSFGREGIPCRTLDSGYVVRLRASPFGYGKAIYMKLDAGETVVYAHLSEFAPDVDSVVAAAQARKGVYEVDITLRPGELPFRRGEVIGYTGRTGTAAPHLHFEVRDAEENPVNPLDDGWVLGDDVPPSIRRVEFLPLTPESRVEGRCAPLALDLGAADARTVAVPETVAVEGRIGIAAQVTDRTDGASGRLAPFRVELEVDGERVASIEMKRFTYANMQEVELAYDMARARTSGQHYLFLFRRRGETLWNRVFARDGVIDGGALAAGPEPAGGIHVAIVRATDRAGHTSTARLPFVVGRPRASASPAAPGATGRARRWEGLGEIAGCYFFEDLASVDSSVIASTDSSGPERARTADAGTRVSNRGEWVLSSGAVGESGLKLGIREKGSVRNVHVVSLRADAPLIRDFSDVGVEVAAEAGSVYSDALVYVTRWERSAGATIPKGSGLNPVTRGVRLGPSGAVFRRPIEIRFSAVDSLRATRAVFRYDARREAWSMVPSTVRGERVTARIREPGVYAVLADTLPPAIGPPLVKSRRSYATGARVREAIVPISDRGGGVDAARTEVYLDGSKRIARWDGFSEKLFVLVDAPNIIGEHELSIVAVDRLGNTSKLVHRFRISPPSSKGGSGGGR